jgi:hypothetical protein
MPMVAVVMILFLEMKSVILYGVELVKTLFEVLLVKSQHSVVMLIIYLAMLETIA